MSRVIYDDEGPRASVRVDPWRGRRNRRGRPPQRLGWDTRPAIAQAAGVTIAAVRRAEHRGVLDVHDLARVAMWIAERRAARGMQFPAP